MYLKTIFIRFYKSFNDDFLRKQENREPKPWEQIGENYYPYIEVPFDSKITTIVGANESGKSHLLSAIEKAISGKNRFGEEIKRSDFCRYSPFFTVKQNELKYPDFGSEWGLSEVEDASIKKIINIHDDIRFDRFLIFRNNIHDLTIYLPDKGKYRQFKLEERQKRLMEELLPKTFRIESSIALPSSVPIKKLVELDQKDYVGSRKFEVIDREQRNIIVNALDTFDDPELISRIRNFDGTKREEIDHEAFKPIKSIISAISEDNFNDKEKEKREKGFNLAYKLICKIAQVDSNSLIDLSQAIKNGLQGYANGIIKRINQQLAINLNFPNYWVQDRNFCLKVMARDYDLVFTITDRTGTEYSFEERSQGLRYLLSYYIEYRSHEPDPNKTEILLMDEPDAYLSSQAQQDLLKVFDLFANPQPGSHLTHPIQVVYVTHSPFLIDKNHTERIRVLQKGNDDEGTRVVKDFARCRYEPLRSSIGPHIGETVFIGNCNLMVEGIGDQILIAGAATYLRSKGISDLETLDLNQITIVDSGGASQTRYMVYLACGRHAEQIAVIVLLDSDQSGNEAKQQLIGKKGGKHSKSLLKEKFILQLGDLKEEFKLVSENATEKIEIEDIIPLEICVEATKMYLREFLKINDNELEFLTENLVSSKIANQTVLDAIDEILKDYPDLVEDSKIGENKAGFARNVIQVINKWSKQKNLNTNQSNALNIFEHNFKTLFRKLNSMQRSAQQKLTNEKLSQKIDRLKKEFITLHPSSAMREDGIRLLEAIGDILEDNRDKELMIEIEKIENQIQNLRRDYKLETDMNTAIDDYPGFKKGLETIKYAGLLASQEETIEEAQEETDKEIQIDKDISDNQLSTTVETTISEDTDNSHISNRRKRKS